MRKVKIDWTAILIYAGALANISLWIRAGDMVEAGGWSFVSSLALGVLMSLGPVRIVQKWAMLKPTLDRTVKGEIISRPNPRWYVAIGAFVAILASEAFLLAPVVMAMIDGHGLLETLKAAAPFWSFGRVLVSAVAVAGLAAVTGVHAPKSDSAKPDKPARPTDKPEPAPKSEPVRKMVRCSEPGCDGEYVWPNGKGAHYKKHHAPVKIDESLLIKKGGE